MGMGNFRGIIVIVTFLAVILLCISTMATQSPELFTTPSASSPQAEHTTPAEMLAWNVTNAFNLNSTHFTQSYEVPNWHWTTWVEQDHAGGGLAINAWSFDYWWITPIAINVEDLKWYNESTGLQVSDGPWMWVSTLDDAASGASGTFSLPYRLTNSRGSLHLFISWNATLYATATAAYSGEGIWFSLSQDWSDRITSLNLIDILSGLFLGSIFGANTLGIDPLYSAIITIVLDAAAVYMIATIVRSFIPFLPGGGD